jgi:uncharacterized membrane protein YdjX (TVP38/TMEM64 family)
VTNRLHLRRRLAIVGALIIAVGLVAATDSLHERAAEVFLLAEGTISQSPLIGMTVFVLLAMISAMVAFFSVAVIAPVAISAWGPGACLALLWLGWFLGGAVAFSIGRFLGRSVASAIIGEDKIIHWEDRIGERTRFVHILLFQAVVPSEIPGYVLGILRYRFSLYLTALGITELPYAIATVYLGESFIEGESMTFILLGIAVITFAVFLWARARPGIAA